MTALSLTTAVPRGRDTAASHPNATRVRDFYAAIDRRDLETAFRDFSPGFRLEVPAQLPFDPGEVRGPGVVIWLARKMVELTVGDKFVEGFLHVSLSPDDLRAVFN